MLQPDQEVIFFNQSLAINHWNKLPDYVVIAQTLNRFKNKLDDFLFEHMIDF